MSRRKAEKGSARVREYLGAVLSPESMRCIQSRSAPFLQQFQQRVHHTAQSGPRILQRCVSVAETLQARLSSFRHQKQQDAVIQVHAPSRPAISQVTSSDSLVRPTASSHDPLTDRKPYKQGAYLATRYTSTSHVRLPSPTCSTSSLLSTNLCHHVPHRVNPVSPNEADPAQVDLVESAGARTMGVGAE